jgi:hypothetical protein
MLRAGMIDVVYEGVYRLRAWPRPG